MTNQRMQDTDHLRNVAYRDASKLNARIEFWKRYGTPSDAWSSHYFDLLEVPPAAAILDIGCGPAHFWQWGIENDRVSGDWSITLTDISQGMLDEARSSLATHGHDFNFEIADVCDLQFANATFDVVTANYMLYHAESQPEAIAEIARVLKPGGRLYAATNSENHIGEFLELQGTHVIDESEMPNVGLAHTAFTLENGGAMLRENFSKVEIDRDESICEATDPQIVIDYVLSMDAAVDEQRLAETVHTHIAQNGHFAVTRKSGVFIARK